MWKRTWLICLSERIECLIIWFVCTNEVNGKQSNKLKVSHIYTAFQGNISLASKSEVNAESWRNVSPVLYL